MSLLELVLIGKTQQHLILDEISGKLIHHEMKNDFTKLREQARVAGFSLSIASSFRSFEDQLKIWNAKARGERPVLSSTGDVIEISTLSKRELIYAILRWSALPGASRHHWGSDFDVFDSSALPDNYKVKLTPDETDDGGVFAAFHLWLDDNLAKYSFFRPYAIDTNGIAPERWHLSYFPLADNFQKNLSYELIESTIMNSDIDLKETLLNELPEIYSRFINISVYT